MHTLVFAMADDVALRLGACQHLLHVAPSQLLERFACQDMDVPGLGVHRRRRALGDLDDIRDDGTGDRLLRKPAHALAGLNQRLEIHPLHSHGPSIPLETIIEAVAVRRNQADGGRRKMNRQDQCAGAGDGSKEFPPRDRRL